MAQFGGGPGGMPPGVPPGAEVPEDNDQRGAGVSAPAAAGEVSARPPLRRHVRQMQAFLKKFWKEQSIDMEQLEITSEQSFKTHNDLPLARIKRIMKSDEDVRMISARARVKSTRCPFLSTVAAQAEAPVLFAKACELFILELTLRSWCYSEQSKRVHPASHMIRDPARPPADTRGSSMRAPNDSRGLMRADEQAQDAAEGGHQCRDPQDGELRLPRRQRRPLRAAAAAAALTARADVSIRLLVSPRPRVPPASPASY